MENSYPKLKIILDFGEWEQEIEIVDIDEINQILFQKGISIRNKTEQKHFVDELRKMRIERPIHSGRIPDRKEIIKFILSQPQFRHSIKTISKYFLGYEIRPYKNNKDKEIYNSIWPKTDRARKYIERKHPNREWVKEKKNGKGRFGSVTYIFTKKS